MKTLWLTGLMLTNLAFAAQPQTVLACWDGTFAYNTFRVEKTEKRFYVSLRGSSLLEKGKAFFLNNRFEDAKVNDWRQQRHLVVSFPLASCTESGDRLACEAGDLSKDVYEQAIFLERDLDDLGKPVHLASKFAVQHLKLEASPAGLTLTKTNRYAGTGEVLAQTLTVKKYTVGQQKLPLICNQSGANSFSAKVSAKLVAHLE